MVLALALALSLFVVAMPLPPRPSRSLDEETDAPSVDVFIPTYNEEPALLANTMAAAKAMDYPPEKLKVWLLDDGGTMLGRRRDDLLAAGADCVGAEDDGQASHRRILRGCPPDAFALCRSYYG